MHQKVKYVNACSLHNVNCINKKLKITHMQQIIQLHIHKIVKIPIHTNCK